MEEAKLGKGAEEIKLNEVILEVPGTSMMFILAPGLSEEDIASDMNPIVRDMLLASGPRMLLEEPIGLEATTECCWEWKQYLYSR